MNALQQHYEAVRALGCFACRDIHNAHRIPELHHPNGKTTRKGVNHQMEVVPLCTEHHTGDNFSIHRTKKTFVAQIGTEAEMLARVERELLENDQ